MFEPIFLIGSISLSALLILTTSIGAWFYVQKRNGQQAWDADRTYMELTFPPKVEEKQISAFIRAIGHNLQGGSTRKGVPTVVFETWARADGGITHRLRVPSMATEYIKNQLYTTIPGTAVVVLEELDDIHFHHGVTVHMHNNQEQIPIASVGDFAWRVLSPMRSAVEQGDVLMTQWVIAYMKEQAPIPKDMPVRSARDSGMASKLFTGNRMASNDEIASRRAKQEDLNYYAIGRVAASSSIRDRSEMLVKQVEQALASEGGSAALYVRHADRSRISDEIKRAATPLYLTAQFSVKELTAVIGWPVGDVYMAGLKRNSMTHMPPPESVPRDGRILGKSTMDGVERPIAMTYEAGLTHTYIAGGTGVGKTTQLKNMGKQDLDAGAGLILLEREGNLFQGMLDLVPPHRMKDVITIDFSTMDRPVGLNILRGRKPEIVAGQFATLLEALYPDSKSIYADQLVRHGIPVLAGLDRATIADLIPLVHPRTPAEKAWARAAVAKSRDKTYRDYFADWYARDEKKLATDSQPLKNRMYEILTPEPIRYLLNQETSSFDPLDVINNNKILLINLAGPSEKAASLIGNMITATVWDAAKRGNPTNPNFLFLDEFQQFSHLSADFEDMLATARRQKLGLVIATQYIERLPKSMQDAVMANARTKIIFQSSSGSSSIHAIDFASNQVRKESFMNLKAYQALARIATSAGISPPVTMATYPDPEPRGFGGQILQMSEAKYGRTIAAIDRADSTRRVASSSPVVKRKDIGRSSYEDVPF